MTINFPFTNGSSEWLGKPGRADATFLLLGLPYSGAGVAAFHALTSATWPLAAAVQVIPVRLPARDHRFGQPHELDPEQIALAITDWVDRPYAIYGHSLGARLGFEVIRALRRLGGPRPVRFYPAAAWPPDQPDILATEVDGLPDDEFLDTLVERIDTPTELRDDPELRELMLPLLRADLGWMRRYRYRAEPPLDVPIVAIAGADDRETGPQQMRGWSRHTSAEFRLCTVPGNHFFVHSAADLLANVLTDDLLGVGA